MLDFQSTFGFTPTLSPVTHVKLLVAGLAIAVAATVVLSTSPAQASTTQTGSCVDGGGVRWDARAIWGSTYTASDGTRKVAVDYAGWTTTKAGTVPTDSAVRTYDATGQLLGNLAWSGGFDYQSGGAYKVRNPINPPSAPGEAKVTVTLGVDGDGFGNCTVAFTQPGTISNIYESNVLTATNAERTSRTLAPLTPQACVDSYAEAQSRAMASENRMYHQDLTPILNTCHLRAVGENVAYGYLDGTSVTAAWMASPGHRANLLNPVYRLIGVGATQDSSGRWYVSQVFGVTA